MRWEKLFNERQQKEIEFARRYVKQFNHGTDGHNAKLIIAEMSDILNSIYEVLSSEDNPDRPNGKLWRIEEIMGFSGNMSLSETTERENNESL